jgi:hypothetical protein
VNLADFNRLAGNFGGSGLQAGEPELDLPTDPRGDDPITLLV